MVQCVSVHRKSTQCPPLYAQSDCTDECVCVYVCTIGRLGVVDGIHDVHTFTLEHDCMSVPAVRLHAALELMGAGRGH